MDAIVTARVPVEIKEQGNKVLKKIGATPTDLVNDAYRYVLDNEALPTESLKRSSRLSNILPEDIDTILASFEASTFDVPETFWGDRTYKEIIEEGKRADYEALD